MAWFYTSNVESYLFQGLGWRRFFANVSTLPIDERSTFIRTLFDMIGYNPQTGPEYRTTMALDPIGAAVKAFANGDIRVVLPRLPAIESGHALVVHECANRVPAVVDMLRVERGCLSAPKESMRT